MSKLKILVVPANDGGCAYYRAWDPFRKLAAQYPDDVEIKFNKNPLQIVEEGEKMGTFPEEPDYSDTFEWADIVMTQNLSNFGGPYTARIVGIAKEHGCLVHYDTDDLLTEVYEGHRLFDVYKDKGLSDITKFIYNNADLVTVTQMKFADRVSKFMSNGSSLAVVKNAIDYNLPCWNEQRMLPKNNVCRYGWVGGIHHEQDVKQFAGVPKLVNQKAGMGRCQWNFFGRPPVDPKNGPDWQQDVWDNYQRIIMLGAKGRDRSNMFVHPAQPPDRYGSFYTHMDVAIAPLEYNNFNDSKSDIKVAECGRYAVPLVATDCGSYSDTIVNGVTGYLIDPSNPRSEWVRILTRLAKDKKHREEMGENLKKITDEQFDLNKVVGQRLDIYREIMSKA